MMAVLAYVITSACQPTKLLLQQNCFSSGATHGHIS
jgi:hypothetical protein